MFPCSNNSIVILALHYCVLKLMEVVKEVPLCNFDVGISRLGHLKEMNVLADCSMDRGI